MRDINHTLLTGGVVRDPVLRHSPAGTSVATLRLAFTTRHRVEGGWQNKANYIDVEVWERQAEVAARHLFRGRQITLDGRLELDEYEDKDGVKRRVHKIIADNVQFPSGGRNGDDVEGPDGRAAPKTAAISSTADRATTFRSSGSWLPGRDIWTANERSAVSAGAERLLTAHEVAERLSMSLRWVHDHARELGLVKCGRSSRFDPAAVERYKERNRVAPPSAGLSRTTAYSDRTSSRKASRWAILPPRATG
jgi:single-strand DNA-binding protein